MFGRTIVALIGALLTVASFSAAQQPAPQPPATSSASNQLVLDKGTPVKIRLKQDLSSADAKEGDNIDFEVVEEVKVGDVVVIPKGSPAVGSDRRTLDGRFLFRCPTTCSATARDI